MLENTELRPLYKTYTRFNSENGEFEEVTLGMEHQDKFYRYLNKQGKNVKAGDLIRVVDGSGNIDSVTGKKRYGVDELFKGSPALVIESELSFITEPYSGLGESSRYVLDLLVLFPGGEAVYTSSTFVVLANDEEWIYSGKNWPKWEAIK